MIDGRVRGNGQDSIRVLHIDDDADMGQLTEEFLRRESDEFDVISVKTPSEALERVGDEQIDCIVSDYDMPDMDGLALLEAVQQTDSNIPFILFTGKGSEEIASEAISKGVFDYLQKEGGTDQYTVLANRIENAVTQYRAEQEIQRRSAWYQQILAHSSDYVLIVDEMGDVAYVSPAIERVMGYAPEEIVGTNAFETVHPDDMAAAGDALAETISDPSREVTVEFRAIASDGSVRWVEARGGNFLDDPIIQGVMVNVRDITERKHREEALERQQERLRELTAFISHDVRNQLAVIDGHVDLIRDRDASDAIDRVSAAVDRIDEMIEEVRTLARSEKDPAEFEPVNLREVIDGSWHMLSNTREEAELSVVSDLTFRADRRGLLSLVENLLVNAIDHAGPDVHIRCGRLPEAPGFFIEDNGPGIDPAVRDHVFDTAYTSAEDGTGLGLAIVERIVETHGWQIQIREGTDGGARFEIRGVEIVYDEE